MYLRMGHHGKTVTVVKMDYYQSDVSMLIFLPTNYNGLSQLEQDFSSFNITRIRKAMKTYDINLTIPKFKIDYDVSLQTDLSKVRYTICNLNHSIKMVVFLLLDGHEDHFQQRSRQF